MISAEKTLVQCDFDGTVTYKDASFLLLDKYSKADWRKLFKQYQDGEITVGQFNTYAFATIKEAKQTLLDYMRGKIEVRPGFSDMLEFCRQKGYRFSIVSNGLDFYIENILNDMGLHNTEINSAKANFTEDGLVVRYIGPDGTVVDTDFKDTYVEWFKDQGYRVIYIGNGTSDLSPARRCSSIYATGDLLEHCKRLNIECNPFTDFHEVIKGMDSL